MHRAFVASVAASLLLVCGFTLFAVNSAPALAIDEVIEATEKHSIVRYKQQQVTDTKEHIGASLDSIVLADLKIPRIRRESRVAYPDGVALLVDVSDSERHLMTNSREKTVYVGPGDKRYKSFLGGFLELQQKKGVTSGKETLDGRETVRYRLQEDGDSTNFWVDATTKLPVRMEYEMINPTPSISRNKFVYSDFEWEPELPDGIKTLEELFSTKPPEKD